MPSIETSIGMALKARVKTLPLGLSIAEPGQVFTPPTGGTPPMPQPYIRMGRVSVSPRRVFVAAGKAHDRRGFLMLTLVYPLGRAVEVYDEIAGQVAAHFADGTQMRAHGVCVTVPEYPHVQDGYQDGGYWVVPIRIPWVA